MPLKPKKNSNPSAKTSSWREGWGKFCDFWRSRRTQVGCGILLLTVAFMLLASFISFLISGGSDYSVLHADGGQIANRAEIQNWLGLPGAWLSMVLIDGTIGFLAFVYIVLLAGFGLRLCGKMKSLTSWRNLCIAVFTMLWGSLFMATIEGLFDLHTYFRLGGSLGNYAHEYLYSYVHILGVVLVLLVTLVLFIIMVDQRVIEHCSMILSKLRWKRKGESGECKEESGESKVDSEDEQTTEIAIEIAGVEPEPTTEEQPTLDIQIEQTAEDPVVEEPAEDITVEQPAEDIAPEAPETPEGFTAEAGEEVEINEDDPEQVLKARGPYDPRAELSQYQFPSLSLLKTYDNETRPVVNPEEQQANANRIVTTLRNYGVEIESIKATVGPTVTLYEVVPKAGTRVSKIQVLENDIMLALAAEGIRIIAPMPGKGTVGIEVPNEKPQVVSMHSVVASKRFQEEQKMRLPVAIGRTITNEVFTFDLAKTPHLLVAGATGQGKSVGLNAIITSLLYKKHPAELKFVLVDPKMVEFTIYKPLLKHYMAAMPDQDDEDIIITDCQKVINTLNSLVIEMEDRYSLLSAANCRNLEDYNEKFIQRQLNPKKDVENRVTKKILHHKYMPYLVIVIDEYGDFIMQAGKEVEHPIQRIAQKARAVGMHMILATQRPDVKIVTGTIKANIPTRIAFRTQSLVDSRTVLDATGANQLIGKGDMLYSAGGNMSRIQCAFVDTPEVEKIVDHIHDQQHYLEPYQLPEYVPEGAEETMAGEVDLKRLDPMFADVARYVVAKQEGSTSRLQRAFEIGYNRAGKLSDQLEAAGIVGPNKGPKGRDVLIQDPESLEALLQQLGV